MGFLARLVDWLRQPSPAPERPTVVLGDLGFTLELAGEQRAAVRWSEVTEIATFKQDCFAYDEIFLEFCVSGDAASWVAVAESCRGFQELRAVMERRYPSIDPDWWERVMHPAFATNEAVLWSTASPARPCG